jgi:broad-specificity NMP kinase
MKHILLHGSPAVGKYTIGLELEKKLGCPFMHNHLTVDVGKVFFEFHTEPFWDLTEKLRLGCIEAAVRHGVPIVIETLCYAHPEDEKFVNLRENLLRTAGGKLIPVFLECSKDELRKRTLGEHRKEMGKIHEIEELDNFCGKWNFARILHENTISIDTNGKTPEECADEIIKSVGLGD